MQRDKNKSFLQEDRHAAPLAAVAAAAAAETAAPTADSGGPQGAASTAAGAGGKRRWKKNPGKVSDRVKPYLVKDLFFNSKERKFLVKQSCKKNYYPMWDVSRSFFNYPVILKRTNVKLILNVNIFPT